MDIHPIKTEEDYNWALAEIEAYFDKEPDIGTEAGDRFEILVTLIAAYEDQLYRIEAPEPIEMLKAHMVMTDRTQTDLAKLLGSASRASEVLSRKRALTVDMIHRLHREWGIPSDCLIAPYHLAEREKASAQG